MENNKNWLKRSFVACSVVLCVTFNFLIFCYATNNMQGFQHFLSQTWVYSLLIAFFSSFVGTIFLSISFIMDRIPDSKTLWGQLSEVSSRQDEVEIMAEELSNALSEIIEDMKNLKETYPQMGQRQREAALEQAVKKLANNGSIKDMRRSPRLRFLVKRFIMVMKGLAESHPQKQSLLRQLDEIESRDKSRLYAA